jgi:hypothetical protein
MDANKALTARFDLVPARISTPSPHYFSTLGKTPGQALQSGIAVVCRQCTTPEKNFN